MMSPENAVQLIFEPSISFRERCAKVLSFQIEKNPIYRRFLNAFEWQSEDAPNPDDIPLLPIRAFKDGQILTESFEKESELVFKSSGTSGMERSTHYVQSADIYKRSIIEAFIKNFPLDEYFICFYLPGYEENPHSSLIWMAKHLVNSAPSGHSRFVTKEDLFDAGWISQIRRHKKKPLLFGAAFGLVDLAESGRLKPIENLEILETGGMKTHRREISKSVLRELLSYHFQIPTAKIHSEYGMCELLSQMYAIGTEWFKVPHWVHISIRDAENPGRICTPGEEGKIGIIDLANVFSCPFLLTNDRGVMDDMGKFQVLGRWNKEDMRGCNFLIDRE